MEQEKRDEATMEMIKEAYEIVAAEPSEQKQNQLASMMLGVGMGYRMASLMVCKPETTAGAGARP